MTKLEEMARVAEEAANGEIALETARDVAFAVLSALRIPNEAMLDAGYCDAPDDIDALVAHWNSLSPEDIWPAMIDAILKEGT